MSRYIISLDQGTTSSRAIIFDEKQNIVSVAQKEFRQIYPQPGWVEHDSMEIYSTQYSVMTEALAKSKSFCRRYSRHRDYKPTRNDRCLG